MHHFRLWISTVLLAANSGAEAFVGNIISSSCHDRISASPSLLRLDAFDDDERRGFSSRHEPNKYQKPTLANNATRTARSSFDRKYDKNRFNSRSSSPESWQHRQKWLQQATKDILRTEPGTLVKGKWHELISMIKAWSKYAKVDPEAPLVMERLIKRLLDEREEGKNKEARLDIDIYNRLLDAWCCAALFRTQDSIDSPPSAASQRARAILVLLQENYETSQTQRRLQKQDASLQPKPNGESFSMVYDVVLKVEGTVGARRVLAWMEYIHKMKRNDLAKPTRSYYIRLLNAYANSSQGQLAEGFLRHMNAVGETADTFCYNVVIKAYTKAKRGRISAAHADRILEEMPVPKDLITYSTVISAWSASGMRSHAVARAEDLLRDIEESPDLEPNTVVLNAIMSAWVKSKNPAAVNRTAELLQYMESSQHAPPDLISYNTHLHALATHAGSRPGYARRANDLLVALEEKSQKGIISFNSNLFSYNCVIDAWSRSQENDSAWHAVKVLRRLIDNKHGPQPDTYSFNQVFSALSRCTKPGSVKLAEQLLDYMEDAHTMKIYRDARPDLVSYTSVICGLARSGEADAPERGERLLERAKAHYASGKTYMKPNRVLYNALVDLWAKSGKGLLGARKAEALLKEMDEIGESNVITYNSVINSWANSKTRCCGNKAEEYLERMWELYETDGEIKPNDLTFNTVINAVSKSQNEGKAQKALRILRRMDKLYRSGYKEARPNVLTYTSVLNAAAFPALSADQRMKRKALDTAMFTLQELQASRYDQPNELTYSTFLKACINLLSDDDETLREVIKETFEQCKKDGQVGEKFLYRLREAAPPDLYKQLLADVTSTNNKSVNVEDLPSTWRCNVNTRRPRKRKAEESISDPTERIDKYSLSQAKNR
jgi:hypothetical protein